MQIHIQTQTWVVITKYKLQNKYSSSDTHLQWCLRIIELSLQLTNGPQRCRSERTSKIHCSITSIHAFLPALALFLNLHLTLNKTNPKQINCRMVLLRLFSLFAGLAGDPATVAVVAAVALGDAREAHGGPCGALGGMLAS